MRMDFIKASDWPTNSRFFLSPLLLQHSMTRFDEFAYIDIFCSCDLASNTSVEDTQASYIERLREKSRSIPMNGTMEMHSYLPRSFSKDGLNNSHSRTNMNQLGSNENLHRPQSAGQQTRPKTVINHHYQQPPPQQTENDFQSKREFFENRTYIDNSSSNTSLSSLQTNILPSKPKLYTLSPSNSQINHYPPQTTISNNPPRNITR